MTNADRIRSMDNTQLAQFIHQLCSSDIFCKICSNREKCLDIVNGDGEIPDGWCERNILGWLQSPYQENDLQEED